MERQQNQLPSELQKALRDYEIAMRDGGQAEQSRTYEALLKAQQRDKELGGAAVVAFFSAETEEPGQQAS